MIVSAQLRLGGFYTRLARDLTTWLDRPAFFLFFGHFGQRHYLPSLHSRSLRRPSPEGT